MAGAHGLKEDVDVDPATFKWMYRELTYFSIARRDLPSCLMLDTTRRPVEAI